jgi:hypothetical protein
MVLVVLILDLLAGIKKEYISLIYISKSKGKELIIIKEVCS